jgi:hypothetical protein
MHFAKGKKQVENAGCGCVIFKVQIKKPHKAAF